MLGEGFSGSRFTVQRLGDGLGPKNRLKQAENREKPLKIAKNAPGGAFGGVLGLKTAKNRGILEPGGREKLRNMRMARKWAAGNF